MRKITLGPGVLFGCLFVLATVLGVVTTRALLHVVPFSDFRGVTGFFAGILWIYVYSFVLYRGFLYFAPLREGVIPPRSRQEFHYHVYLLFYLFLFHPLTRSLILPVPVMRLVYLALGAHLGDGTYSAGTILDPPLTHIGHNTIIGHDAVLFSHVVEGHDLSLAMIRIGDNVTVGAKAVIMPGVTIGDGSIVAVSAVVAKGTTIGPREVWSGTPARMVRAINRTTASSI